VIGILLVDIVTFFQKPNYSRDLDGSLSLFFFFQFYVVATGDRSQEE
jgi:hypothetical protein